MTESLIIPLQCDTCAHYGVLTCCCQDSDYYLKPIKTDDFCKHWRWIYDGKTKRDDNRAGSGSV